LAACALIGAFGLIILTENPSFVVTLAGLLGGKGSDLRLRQRQGAVGGVITISNNVIDDSSVAP
jgi:ABC-type xylose transport system permease subunit